MAADRRLKNHGRKLFRAEALERSSPPRRTSAQFPIAIVAAAALFAYESR